MQSLSPGETESEFAGCFDRRFKKLGWACPQRSVFSSSRLPMRSYRLHRSSDWSGNRRACALLSTASPWRAGATDIPLPRTTQVATPLDTMVRLPAHATIVMYTINTFSPPRPFSCHRRLADCARDAYHPESRRDASSDASAPAAANVEDTRRPGFEAARPIKRRLQLQFGLASIWALGGAPTPFHRSQWSPRGLQVQFRLADCTRHAAE